MNPWGEQAVNIDISFKKDITETGFPPPAQKKNTMWEKLKQGKAEHTQK